MKVVEHSYDTLNEAEQKDKTSMAKSQTSLGPYLPCRCDDLVDGLSIKGAAIRRQEAIEHVLLIEKAGIKMGRKIDTDGSRRQPEKAYGSRYLDKASDCVDYSNIRDGGSKGKEIDVSNVDAATVNSHEVNAEIASGRENFNSLKPTSDHHRCHATETAGTRRASSGSMPPLPSMDQSRKNSKGFSARRKDMSNSPRLPSWLATIQASNPAKPLPYTGLQLPNSIPPAELEAYSEGRELGIIRWPGPANPFNPVSAIEAWIQGNGGPLPTNSANLNPSHNVEAEKNKRSSVPLPYNSIAEPNRMVLRDQSTNFPPLPSPNGHHVQGQPTTSKEQPKWRATQLLLPNQTRESGSRGRIEGSASKVETPRLLVSNQIPDESRGRTEAPAALSRVPVNHQYNVRLATNSTDFLSKATATLNNLRQPLSSQARSPLSTERTGEEASPQVPKPIASPVSPGSTVTLPQGPAPARVRAIINTQDVAGSIEESTESYASNEPVRGQGDENRLSSIPESMFFEHAYNGENASFTSEVIFEGRRPKNRYKDPPVKRRPVPGWEGPDYEPGQLMGWDGKWQEAPVEWDSRDLYDYTAKEHQNNVKNYIDDRYEQYKAGRCPPIEVTTNPLFTSGRGPAIGSLGFARPINEEEHHHLSPEDPFSLGKLAKTAAMSIDDYLRVHEKRLKEQETREQAAAERKKTAKAQRTDQRAEQQAEQQAREQALAEAAAVPNPYSPKLNIFIRPAKPQDLHQICELHNYYVRSSAVTGERVELSEREWRTRFDTRQEDKFAFLVAILVRHSKMDRRQSRTEKVVGFTYTEDFAGERTMWGYTCELQLFVHHKYLRQGIGKNLVDCILRSVDPTYHSRNAVQFAFPPDDTYRYEGGGERVITNIVFPLPYTVAEDRHAQWLGEWLGREFGFVLQGLLVGIGRLQGRDSRVNLAYYVAETGTIV